MSLTLFNTHLSICVFDLVVVSEFVPVHPFTTELISFDFIDHVVSVQQANS
jgi:hypothetical protein